jgi:DNA polymerase I-like protein with 3'-5' exonuclease and polymerase domains
MLTIDLETAGLGPKPRILGIAWAFSSPSDTPVSGASEWRDDDAPLWQALFLRDTLVFFNAPFDVRVLREHGFSIPSFVDAKLACHCWDSSHESYTLNDCLERFGYEAKLEFAPEGGWESAEWSDEMAEYAEHDALQTHRLYQDVMARLGSDAKALHHYQTIEVPYQEVILNMERQGLTLDLVRLERVRKHLSKKAQGLRRVMAAVAGFAPGKEKTFYSKTLIGDGLTTTSYRTVRAGGACWIADRSKTVPARAGMKLFAKGEMHLPAALEKSELVYEHCTLTPFNPNSGKQIAERLKTLYGWEPTAFTPTGEAATGAEHLEHLDYPLARMLVKYFEVNKVLTAFVEPFSSLQRDGVLRGRFNQTGTRTGRLSSSQPNLQNIPARGPLGVAVRSMVVAPPGDVLVDIDLSNIEGRVLAEYLSRIQGDHKMTQIFRDGVDFHQANADAWKVTRSQAKTLLYAVLYGAGPEKVGGGDKEYGKELMKRLEANAPSLLALKKRVYEEATLRGGVIHTLFGRRLCYPELLEKHAMVAAKQMKEQNPELENVPDWKLANSLQHRAQRQIFNALLQGTAADLRKILTLRVMPLLKKRQYLRAAVHDELVLTSPRATAKHLAEELTRIFSTNDLFEHCPIMGEAKIGVRWAETH